MDAAAAVAKRELQWETDYVREAAWAEKFRCAYGIVCTYVGVRLSRWSG